jgi:predicted lipid-binding transport protein (Tim44 family)
MLGHGGGWGGGGGGWGSSGGGGGGGLMTILVQLAILAGLAWLAVKVFRMVTGRRRGVVSPYVPASGPAPTTSFFGGGSMPSSSYAPYAAPPYGGTQPASLEFPVTAADEAAVERLLVEIQDAFGREDFAALRERTTPEVMSYLAEELSQNSVNGVRNAVSNTRLLQADVSEAWREAEGDYVTTALRYESVDVMRDRATGAIRTGDPTRATPTTELWTFVRPPGGAWKLSAIQETQ